MEWNKGSTPGGEGDGALELELDSLARTPFPLAFCYSSLFLPLAGLNRVEALPAAEPVPLRRPAPPSSLISRHKSLPSRGFQINLAGGRRLK